MLNQFAVEIPTLPVDQCHSHLIRYLEECCDSLSYRRAAEKGRQAFGTHMVYRETFLQIQMRLHQHLIHKNCINGIHRSKSRSIRPTVEKSERQEQNRDLRCQSGPSAKDSVVLSGGDYSKNYGADQQRLQISDLHFDKIPYTSYVCLLEDKIQDRSMYLFTIPYRSHAMVQRSGDG